MVSLLDLSYLHTPADKPYNYTTVAWAARENAQLRPNQEILILRELDGSRSSLTNASLYQQAGQLARYLVAHGITKGDTVALLGPNTLEMAIATLGIMRAGAVVFNVVVNMKKEDVKAQLQIVNAKFLMVDCGKNDSFGSRFKDVLEHCGAVGADSTSKYNNKILTLRKTDLHYFRTAETLQNIQNTGEVELPHIYPDDNVIVFSTSGSTGIPKMVPHSNFDCVNIEQRFTGDYQRIVFNNGLFFNGVGSIVNALILSETRVFLETNSPKIDFIWRVLKEERCSDAFLLDLEIRQLLELSMSVEDDRFRLQHIVTGGQVIDNYCTGVLGQVCQKMVVLYGTNESQGIAMKIIHDSKELLQAGDVAGPVPGVEIRVVDNQDNPIKRGLIGNVQARSPVAMKGYVCNPEKTKEVFTEEHWYRTGDIGKISLDGNLILLGRDVEVVNRGTSMIYPSMLESVFKEMKAIKEVCVVPVPDKKLYEEICVCFVPFGQLTPDDIKQYFKQNYFQAAKTFSRLDDIRPYFLQFEAFPKLASSKLDRKAIRQHAIARLGLTMEYDN